MAAVAMIVGETDDLQLGFPSAYESSYAAHKVPLRAFPSVQEPVTTMWAGDDLQAQWHQQKLRDAQYMSGAKVQSTQNSIKRAYSAAHHEFNRPKYVLGQRKFANPSNGAQILTAGRQNYDSAPFHYTSAHNVPNRQQLPSEMEGAGDCCDTFRGGVLRSAAGQVHGHNMLRARVGQLNAIDEASRIGQLMGSFEGVPAFVDSFQQLSTEVSAPITINLGLQRVIDLLMGNDVLNTQESGFRSADSIFSETRSVLGGILAMGAKATVSELSDTLGMIQNIEQLLQAALETDQDDPYMDEYANKTTQSTFITLQELYKKLNKYMTRMVAGANLQPKDRETLARSLVKSLGFGKSMDVAVGKSREALSLAERTGTPAARQDALNVGSRGHFNRDGDRREDSEQGSRGTGPGGSWGDTNRSEFGWRSGESFPTNGRSVSWFGTEEGDGVEYGEAPEDADTSGFNEEGSELPYRSRDVPVPLSERRQRAVGEDVPLRGFFDPDTQAFNVSQLQPARSVASSAPRIRFPPSPGGSVVSRRATPARVPVGREGLARAVEGIAPPNVLNLLKGRVSSSAQQRSSENPRAPARTSSAAAAAAAPRTVSAIQAVQAFRSAAAPAGAPLPTIAVPNTAVELPDDVLGLEYVSKLLRNQGYYGVPQIYGTKAAPSSAAYKSYIRNVKAKIIEYTRG